MTHTLQVSKPLLMRWLNSDVKNQKVILFDLEPDLCNREGLRLDFNVIIKPYRIKRRRIGLHTEYFVGCSSVLIRFDVSEGEIKNHTSNQKLDVNYENSFSRQRHSSFKLIPDITVKKYEAEVKEKVDEVLFEAEAESTFLSSYKGQVRWLTALNIGNTIQWEIIMPEGQKVNNDFFTANLYFFVDSYWKSLPGKGTITVEATKIGFFDSDHQPLKPLNSLMMEILLRRKGILLRETDISFDFTFTSQDS